MICFLTVIAGVVVFIKIRERNFKKAKRILEEKVRIKTRQVVRQKDEIETQRDNILEKSEKLETAYQEIETKNIHITDSIRYAEYIQKAILPPIEEIKKTLPESFILFKPKDIVSGDFYFYAKVGNTVIIAACDCTGHGVPGAFMSMIGSQLFDKIVFDKNVNDAAEVLNKLREGIIHALGKAGATGKQKDGMDIAICALHHNKDKGVVNLQYAGAYNPLYIIRNMKNSDNTNGLEEIKADRQPVGYYEGDEQPFTSHQLQLQKGDVIYIFSDGYADQLGGDRCKKFGYNRFRQLLTDISDKNMEEQKQILDKTIEAWKDHIDPYDDKPLEQMDDILVMGMRF